jgi:hypothetical protein
VLLCVRARLGRVLIVFLGLGSAAGPRQAANASWGPRRRRQAAGVSWGPPRPQQATAVSCGARPARPSQNFRAPPRRDVARARESGQESMPQRGPAGDGNCCAPHVDDQTPARPAAAVMQPSDFRMAKRNHVASGGAVFSSALHAISKLSTMGSRHRLLLQKTLKNTDISHKGLLQWDDRAGRRSALATVPRVL